MGRTVVLATLALLGGTSIVACGGGSSSAGDVCALSKAEVSELVEGVTISSNDTDSNEVASWCVYSGERADSQGSAVGTVVIQTGIYGDDAAFQVDYDEAKKAMLDDGRGYESDKIDALADGGTAYGLVEGKSIYSSYEQRGYRANGNSEALDIVEAFANTL